jgi:pSer/pThr/pTyr-binding forkhead associated (FHA) protein
MPRVAASPALASAAAPEPAETAQSFASAAPSAPPPPSVPPSQRRGARPAAPVFSFQPTEPSPSMVCSSCQTPNPPGYRFCVTCGASLQRATSGAPADARRTDEGVAAANPAPPVASVTTVPLDPPPRAAKPVVARTAPPDEAASEGKIVGSPVLDIASSGSVPAKLITCARCHGNCVAGSRFCKFCGAPLEEAAPAPTRVEAAQPAPRAAPPPPPNRGAAAPISSAAIRGAAPVEAAPLRSPIPPRPRPLADDAPPISSEDAGNSGPPILLSEPRQVAARVEPASNGGAGPSPRPKAPIEPGRRAEISVLAGSPIPAEPMNLPPQRAVRDGVRRETGRTHPGRLVVIVEDGSEGRSFSLADGQLDIGRTDGDIVLEDDHYVSPRHARLRFLDGQWILRDLDSTNHVYLRIRKPQPLKDGDLLLLGLEVLQFQTVSDGERGLGHAMQHGTLLFGSPATPRRARLCQRTVEGVVRDVFHLFRDETVIGRETGDIVFTADPFLSRRHAAIRRSATTGEFSLLDLDSSNGTFIAITGEVSLANGDFLRIGQHLFRVDLG